MRRLPAPWWGDLAAVIALALVGLVLALTPVSGPVRVAALLPLVLILPGYALAAALFMPRDISPELRFVLCVAFSIGVWALGGLVMQLVIRLDRPVWAALLACVTVAAAVVALRRRDALPATGERPRPRLRGVGPASLVAMLAAMAIAGWAIAIATRGAHRQLDESHFSSLSLVPRGSSGIGPPVRIGVSNHEGRTLAYRLTVSRGTRTITRWRFRLAPDQDWQARLTAAAISGTGPLIGRLHRGGLPSHRVALQMGGIS